MKLLNLLVMVVFLTACQQLLQGQEQSVRPLKDGAFITTCGGAVEDWASCNRKAMKTCASNYQVLSKKEDGSGTVRELTFQCNK